MSATHGKRARIYCQGYNLSPFLDTFNLSAEAELPEDTRFDQDSKTYAAGGITDATVSGEGFLETGSAPKRSLEILRERFNGAATVLTYLPSGDAFGNPAFGVDGIESAFEITAELGELERLSIEVQSNVGMEPGRVLHPLAARAATGNGTSLDNGAASAEGAAAFLHVTEIDGADPEAVVKVQHSVDGSAWVDLITFDAVEAANEAQRKTVAGSVNRYLRARHELAGDTSATYSLAVVRK